MKYEFKNKYIGTCLPKLARLKRGRMHAGVAYWIPVDVQPLSISPAKNYPRSAANYNRFTVTSRLTHNLPAASLILDLYSRSSPQLNPTVDINSEDTGTTQSTCLGVDEEDLEGARRAQFLGKRTKT